MPKGKKLLSGVGGAPGEVVATVRVVNKDPEKMAKVQPGEVLVGVRFYPAHNKYLKQAVALITDGGGPRSHEVIWASEVGKPSVTGTTHATEILKDGQKVVVDGNEKAVYEYIGPAPLKVEAPPVKAETFSEKMERLAKEMKIPMDPAFIERMRKRD